MNRSIREDKSSEMISEWLSGHSASHESTIADT